MTDPHPGVLRRDLSGDGTEVVIGIDIGGSSTRAVARDRNGSVGPIGRADGGNPSTRHTEEIAAAVNSATDRALAGRRRPDVGAVVVGLAGLERIAAHPGARLPADGGAGDDRWQIIRATLHMHPSEIATFSGIALSGNDEAARALVTDTAGWLR